MVNTNLKELEERMNRYYGFDFLQEEYSFKVKDQGEEVSVICYDGDTKELVWDLNIPIVDDMDQLLKNMISQFYEDYINHYNRIIRSWSGYSARKVKSINTWLIRNNMDRVNKIQLELVEQYKRFAEAKDVVAHNKQFIKMFYHIKDKYEIAA
ncbi:hypothetical protein [Clostridium sp. C8-1-8]|uniref:hypothetical protein n=1 Tax=Clostridium sp. C8-1-8 TaxID=2698831 RepID=UPI0013714711|nr:hypothetical protein [Clostridium sp. C8-1-8]